MKKIIWIIVVIFIALGIFFAFSAWQNSSQKNGSGVGNLASFFPFGETSVKPSNNTIGNGGGGGVIGNSGSSTSPYDPLIQISKRQTVGMTILMPNTPFILNQVKNATTTGTSTVLSGATSTALILKAIDSKGLPVVRFVEHGTGYVYDVSVRADNETKRTGTVIARAAQAYFGNNGNTIVFRYLKEDNSTIETYLGQIIPSALVDGFANITGVFLPENITDLAVSPDTKSFVYLLPTSDGVAGISIRSDGSGKKELFSSPFDEWLLDLKNGGLKITTKASNGILGYMYSVSPTGILQKVIGDIAGLTTNASPDGRQILYDTSSTGQISLYVRQVNGNSVRLGVATLPEKCVWSKDSINLYCAVPIGLNSSESYPDDWYQGIAHFQDAIWKINTSSGSISQINNLESNQIDAVDLVLDTNESFLVFKNKNDDTLWSLDLRSANKQ